MLTFCHTALRFGYGLLRLLFANPPEPYYQPFCAAIKAGIYAG